MLCWLLPRGVVAIGLALRCRTLGPHTERATPAGSGMPVDVAGCSSWRRVLMPACRQHGDWHRGVPQACRLGCVASCMDVLCGGRRSAAAPELQIPAVRGDGGRRLRGRRSVVPLPRPQEGRAIGLPSHRERVPFNCAPVGINPRPAPISSPTNLPPASSSIAKGTS